MTRAPSFANIRAAAAPMPCPEPVIMATCPASMPPGNRCPEICDARCDMLGMWMGGSVRGLMVEDARCVGGWMRGRMGVCGRVECVGVRDRRVLSVSRLSRGRSLEDLKEGGSRGEGSGSGGWRAEGG